MGNETSKKIEELKTIAKGSKTSKTIAGPSKPGASSSKNTRTGPTAQATPTQTTTPAPTNVAATITTSPMEPATMDEMMAAVVVALPDKSSYRVIGGVALSRFGSSRRTKDLDLLVPNNTVASVVEKLLATEKFRAEKRTGGTHQVWFHASNGKNYNVDIMGPAQIHRSLSFPSSYVTIGGACVLGPAQLLNMKILAYQIRKKINDAEDILYLVHWMAQKGMKTSPAEVTYADPDFLQTFTVQKHPSSKRDWIVIGLPPP